MCPLAEDVPLLHQLKFLKLGHQTLHVVEGVAAKWTDLACVLKLKDSVVQIIKKNKKDDCVEACEEMFRCWLSGGGEVTWERLIEALRDAQHGSLADTLQKLLHKP